MGGLIGTVEQWENLEGRWAMQLANPLPEVGKPKLQKFHMADCEASQGEFRGYRPPERMLVAQHFRRHIAECGLAHTSSSVDVAAWDQLIIGTIKELLGPAIEVCFVNCLDRARQITAHGDMIAVVFDQGLQTDRLYRVIDLYKKHAGDKIVSITFGKVKDIYPLQAADIIVTQHYWMAQEWMNIRPTKDPDVAFRHVFKGRPGEGLIFDREAIINERKRRGPDGRLLTDTFGR
jgi:hypothetical protein